MAQPNVEENFDTNSALSLPIFQLSAFLVLVIVIIQITSLLKNFMWKGGKKNEQKLNLVKWNTLKAPISSKGLNIKYLKLMNQEMGAKICGDW